MLFCSLKRGLTPKIRMLCFVIIYSVYIFYLLCVWNTSSHSCLSLSLSLLTSKLFPPPPPTASTNNYHLCKSHLICSNKHRNKQTGNPDHPKTRVTTRRKFTTTTWKPTTPLSLIVSPRNSGHTQQRHNNHVYLPLFSSSLHREITARFQPVFWEGDFPREPEFDWCSLI